MEILNFPEVSTLGAYKGGVLLRKPAEIIVSDTRPVFVQLSRKKKSSFASNEYAERVSEKLSAGPSVLIQPRWVCSRDRTIEEILSDIKNEPIVPPVDPAVESTPPVETDIDTPTSGVECTDAAKKLADESDIDIAAVPHLGHRVTRADVQAVLNT